jgi:phospholipid/cholesterol/gamma-HCH transport system substrate-binding protein
MRRRWTKALVLGVLLATTGCSINSMALPGSDGVGDDPYKVHIELASMSGTEPNTAVMVDHVSVGTVTDIRVQDWHAVATLRINRGVELPANTTAKVAQTSLLGAKHIELTRPARPAGTLAEGDTIPLSRTGAFPDTEDVLASASLLLNGGGLQNVRTIVRELNSALGGRGPEIRRTLRDVTKFIAGLDAQKADIVRALRGLDRLSTQAAKHNTVIKKTLRGVPPALKVLQQERTRLTRALKQLGKFSDSAGDVLDKGTGPLVRNLKDIHRVMKSLADSGDDLVTATGVLASGPFPVAMAKPENSRTRGTKGDFPNLYVTLDFTDARLNDLYLQMVRGLDLSKAVREISEDPTNPLTIPLLGDDKPTLPLEKTAPALNGAGDLVGQLLGGGK